MTEGYPAAWQHDVADEGGASAAPGYHRLDPQDTGVVAEHATSDAHDHDAPDHDAQADADQGKAGAAKEQAAAVGQGAADAGKQVAGVAKDQAQNVVAEAGSQAKDLLSQARSELTEQAGAQQKRLAEGLRALGDELEAMTHHSEQPGVATDLAKQAATRSHDAASWLDSREPGHLLEELQSFARAKPGAFLALAAGAGLVAGRLGRGVKDAGGDDTAAPAGTAGAPTVGTAGIGHDADGGVDARPFASSQVDEDASWSAGGDGL
jgi:hypothetical protein